MSKPEYTLLPPSTLLCPTPVVLVSCADPKQPGKPDMVTAAWAGTVNSEPPMVSVSLRKDRFSHGLITASGEFVVNLADEKMARALDFCGVRSGRDTDKSRETGLRYIPAEGMAAAPAVEGAPVSLSCRVRQVIPLGSHDLFLAEVVCVDVDEAFLDEKQRLDLRKADLVAYSHGEYFELGEKLGKFGYSVAKKPADSKKPATTKKTAPTKKSATTKQATANKTVTSKKTVASRKQSMGASQSGAVRRKDQKKK